MRKQRVLSRKICRRVAPVVLSCACLAVCGIARADSVPLSSGGVLHGNILSASSSKTVTIRTREGALVVLNRESVTQVKRGADAAEKLAAAKRSAKSHATPAEQAWMPKVRALASRLLGDVHDQSRRARTELLKIDDPDALPALGKYLLASPNEGARHLFVTIARSIRGSKPLYYLVEQSLFDPSPQLRDEARKAIGTERGDFVRPLYIEALKSGDPNLATRAALAIAEFGDPAGESVPYLIASLVSDAKATVMTQAAQWGVLYNIDYYTTGSATVPGAIYVGQDMGSSTMPVRLGSANMSQTAIAAAMSNLHQAPPNSGTGQLSGSGTYYITPVVANHYVLPIVGVTAPAKYTQITVPRENPIVLDTLLKITDRKMPANRYNRDNWHRWWLAERKNREAQESRDGASRSDDRALTKSQAAP